VRPAASAEPPPIPAATGIRLTISIRTGGASQPALAQQLERGRDEVRAADAAAHDLVGTAVEDGQLELVGERHRLEHCHELVPSVGAPLAPARDTD